jgi:hypothetical protein
MVFLSPVAC